VMQHNLGWFNHYIFGDPAPDFVSPAVPKKGGNEEDGKGEVKAGEAARSETWTGSEFHDSVVVLNHYPRFWIVGCGL
jgi:hypothetical protein